LDKVLKAELPQMSGKKLSRKVKIMVPLSRKTWSCVTFLE